MRRNLRLCLHWARMLAGSSYYHVPQELGKAFEPDRLHGYFNDMTFKTNWKGLQDGDGIPLVQTADGAICYFVTTIIQKGLGHHDRFLLTGDTNELDKFLGTVRWLVKEQDMNGGWDSQTIMNLPKMCKYSAMPLGEAISVLVRAWKHTNNELYFEAAKKAYELMITPIQKGGPAYYKDNEIYLEEYPAKERNSVLNGWIFALFGIYDLFLATNDDAFRKVFDQSLSTLKKHLAVYDADFWSYYDEQKTLASPFYHSLHVSQLEALFLVRNDEIIIEYIEKWKIYKKKRINRYRAITLKAYQKLKKPAPIVIIG